MKVEWMLAAMLAWALAIPSPAQAQSAREMRKQVEASMLVTGTIDIDRNGKVTSHAVDQREKLPAYVADLIDRAVPAMGFEPVLVDGQPVLARAKMSLRLVATPADDGNMTIAIRSAHFGEERAGRDAHHVRRAVNMLPPKYPLNIAQMGGKGTVYLLVKVARDGSVEDAFAEQVNLTALGTAKQMEVIRNSLAKSAIDTARKHWRFVPPVEGEHADSSSWVVRVPVEFSLGDDRKPGYGEWSPYVPGPAQRPEWASQAPQGFSPDALAAGGIHAGESKFKLITPLQGG